MHRMGKKGSLTEYRGYREPTASPADEEVFANVLNMQWLHLSPLGRRCRLRAPPRPLEFLIFQVSPPGRLQHWLLFQPPGPSRSAAHASPTRGSSRSPEP